MSDNHHHKLTSAVILIFSIAAAGVCGYCFITDYRGLRAGLLSHPMQNVSVALFILFVLSIFFIGLMLGRIFSTIRDESRIRKDALKRSRSVLGGLAAEQIAPYLPDFPCNPADVRFVGKPVDYIGFRGITEHGRVDEILLIEVKTGSSQLSDIEMQIRDAVKSKNVRYEEYRLK